MRLCYQTLNQETITMKYCFALLVTTLALVLLPMAIAPRPVRAAERPPNVLLVMSDDQGWGDIRSHGNPLIDTPVQDALAASGARFERFFVSPVCAPTRASLLTGRYHLRTGVHGISRGYETMRSNEVTMAEVLKAAGYATGCFGKWHNGAHYPEHPNGQGFDQFVGFCGCHWNNYFDTLLERNGEIFRSKGFIVDYTTDPAIDFIRANRDRSFFCYAPISTPHSPFQAPDRYFDKYKARGLDDTLACIYGMCENIDDNLGRMLEVLDKLDLADNTIVVFLTDNGPNTDRFNGGMKGRKSHLDEGGSRVPLFIRWPGRIEPGAVVKKITSHIDLLPTLVELCGVPMIETLPQDGISLVPLIQGKTEGWPDRTLLTHWDGRQHPLLDPPDCGSVRTEQYRAVYYGKRWELYDMVADPGQKSDIAADEPELTKKLSDWYDRTFADCASAGFDPIPFSVGCEERPDVELLGHEAFLVPNVMDLGISYDGWGGWANDWVTNWTSVDAYPYWDLDVVRGGKYKVTLMYVCPESEVGSRICVTVADKVLEGTISKAHDPQPLPSPDRVPRAQVYEKVWAPLVIGQVELPQGRTRLAVKVISIANKQMMDLKEVRLERVE